MQYLASSPRHMPTHTNTHKKGSNPPFLSSLGSQAQLKVKHKNRFPPPSTHNSSAHPQLFYWSSSLTQILIKSWQPPSWLLVYVTVHTRCKVSHIYCFFFCMSHCGVTHAQTQSALCSAPISLAVATALIAQQETRFITLVQSPFQVRCRVRRKVPPGVPWLPGEVSYQMCVWSGGARSDGTDIPACN